MNPYIFIERRSHYGRRIILPATAHATAWLPSSTSGSCSQAITPYWRKLFIFTGKRLNYDKKATRNEPNLATTSPRHLRHAFGIQGMANC
jgi:hypothetical protein